jgi:hypothetical protein
MLEGDEGSASRPGRFLPPGKTRYPLYRRLGGPQGLSVQVWKILPPPGFDPWTVQPIASCCTDCATRPVAPFVVLKKTSLLFTFLVHYVMMLNWLALWCYILFVCRINLTQISSLRQLTENFGGFCSCRMVWLSLNVKTACSHLVI